MKVSIIVPFYNVESYFRRCLDSIINQTYQDLEIILVNDCSPDNSIAIAREYAQKDPRIKIIEHEYNKGLGGARNSGLAHATGEYLWFIDSDDAIASLGSVVSLISQIEGLTHLPEIIQFGLTIYQEQADVGEIFRLNEASKLLSPREIVEYMQHEHRAYFSSINEMAWNKWFRVDFLRGIGATFEEKIIWEDAIVPFWLFLAASVLLLPESHYLYYRHKESITGVKKPINFLTHHKLGNLLGYQKFINKNPQAIAQQNVFALILYVQTFMSQAVQDVLREKPKRVRLEEFTILAKQYIALVNVSSLLSYLSEASHYRFLSASIDSQRMKQVIIALDAQQYQRALRVILPRKNMTFYFKRTIQAVLPYGIVQGILKRRGWAIQIKRAN